MKIQAQLTPTILHMYFSVLYELKSSILSYELLNTFQMVATKTT